MSDNTNIWQIVSRDDLMYFLRKGVKQFVVLALVLSNTPKELKSLIKKIMKQKANKYKNVTFLYYTVRPEDFNKISILDGDVEKYPKICHIYDVKDLLRYVNSIDGPECIEKTFEGLDKYYLNDSEQSQQQLQQTQQPQQNKQHQQTQQNQQNQTQQYINNIQNDDQRPYDIATEKKKIHEKLEILEKHAEEFTTEFLKDCAHRKKKEEKKERNKDK